MGRHPIVTIKAIQEMNRLYSKGYSMAEIGRKMGLGHSTICNYIWSPRTRGTAGLYGGGEMTMETVHQVMGRREQQK